MKLEKTRVITDNFIDGRLVLMFQKALIREFADRNRMLKMGRT
jgi:hypothetical protein